MTSWFPWPSVTAPEPLCWADWRQWLPGSTDPLWKAQSLCVGLVHANDFLVPLTLCDSSGASVLGWLTPMTSWFPWPSVTGPQPLCWAGSRQWLPGSPDPLWQLQSLCVGLVHANDFLVPLTLCDSPRASVFGCWLVDANDFLVPLTLCDSSRASVLSWLTPMTSWFHWPFVTVPELLCWAGWHQWLPGSYWVGIALHPWPVVSDIAIFVLKRDVKLEQTNCDSSRASVLSWFTFSYCYWTVIVCNNTHKLCIFEKKAVKVSVTSSHVPQHTPLWPFPLTNLPTFGHQYRKSKTLVTSLYAWWISLVWALKCSPAWLSWCVWFCLFLDACDNTPNCTIILFVSITVLVFFAVYWCFFVYLYHIACILC